MARPSDPSTRGDAPRRVIITGAARGIGAAIAHAFAVSGDALVLLDVLADDVACTADRLGARAVWCDLGDDAAIERAMSEAVEHLGGVDVLVNNAGIFAIRPILDITPDEWDRMFTVNVRSMLLTIQAAARVMIDAGTGGRIVNMASMGGKDGAAGQAHYAASKAAVISLTQVAAKELGEHGITVNSICPGYVLTDMGAATRTPEMVAGWSRLSPLGRCGEPSDVADVAMFLASPGASYLTGQAIDVSGGMCMR